MKQGSRLRVDQQIAAVVGAVLIAFLAIVTFFLLTAPSLVIAREPVIA